MATNFTQKVPESSDSMYSSILMLENILYHHFAWSVPNLQEIVNLLQFSSGPQMEKTYNFLWIWSTAGKMMISYVLQHKKEGIHGIWAFWHFSSKSGHQKYSAWVPRNPAPSCFGSVMSLFEKTYTFSEPNCCT